MIKLTLKSNVEEPSHVVECSGLSEYAFIFSKKNHSFSKIAWSPDAEYDKAEIDKVNSKLPKDCPRMNTFFTAKLNKKLSEFFIHDNFIVGFDDEVVFPLPDAIFLQRVSPYTKTFDMVCFYGRTFHILSIVDRKDLQDIRDWYPYEIFSCSADPLPLKYVKDFLKNASQLNMYKNLFNSLFATEESSCSEYEQSEESDEEYESDDPYESEDIEVSEGELSEGYDNDSEYEPDEYEPELKKRKCST